MLQRNNANNEFLRKNKRLPRWRLEIPMVEESTSLLTTLSSRNRRGASSTLFRWRVLGLEWKKKQTNINFSFSANFNCNQGVGRERQADLRQDVWISNTRPYHKPWQHDCCLPQVKKSKLFLCSIIMTFKHFLDLPLPQQTNKYQRLWINNVNENAFQRFQWQISRLPCHLETSIDVETISIRPKAKRKFIKKNWRK